MMNTVTDIFKKFRTLGYVVFTSTFVWFTYWIFYDVIIWNKSLGQVNFINYVGAILSIILVFAGHFLGKPNIKMDLNNYMIPSPPQEKLVPISEKAPIKPVNVAEEKVKVEEKIEADEKIKVDNNLDDVRKRLQKIKEELDKIQNNSN